MNLWITASDIMTIAKIFDLNYEDAKKKIVELVADGNDEVEFV